MTSVRPRILLIGAAGQVGWELHRCLATIGEVVPTSRDGEVGLALDLADTDRLVGLLDEVKPGWVINAAAYTAVDRAEEEPELAAAINARAPAVLGELAVARDIGVIHYSTDYVFSGEAGRPYRETDPTGPRNVYGETKLAGEQALLDSGAAALVLRTSWVYGTRGANFLLSMQRLAAERDELRVVDDQTGSPTWSRMIAEATGQVLSQLVCGQRPLADARGVYHLTAAGQTSWYGFARAILRAGSNSGCRLIPIPTSEYPTPAQRPAYSVLDNSRLAEVFCLGLPDWRDSLARALGVPSIPDAPD